MLLLARLVLVLFTALAASAATSLQGRVLCYGESGQHMAVEAPHPESPCLDGHSHPGDSSQERQPKQDPHRTGCTDVSADFQLTRAASRATLDTHHAELAVVLAMPLLFSATPTESTFIRSDGVSHPPARMDLDCLRTVVLLV